ncbi:T9SS type A sorting domain-containing protein [Bizionia paragorgiae]|jgi:hypothetical protein|uniref:T9SS type A sorting domain-containing protein n=2 Tax=Bizionia paragorgiae TaxID=283786 RepID=UPI003A940998
MKSKIQLLIILITFCTTSTYAQITTEIIDVLVNNQTTVNNCSLIDIEDNSNVSLTIYFKLTKPSNQALGTTNVKALLKYSNSSYGNEKGNYSVQSNSWSNNDTEFYGQIPISISESEIQVNGSSIFIKSVTDSNVEDDSCEYPLTKTQVPTFTISPTTTGVVCNDISPKTFTVNNVYNSPGTLSYNWNVGNGWKRDGEIVSTFTTNTNTVTLTPYLYPPSNVNVTVILNNSNYTSLTSAVSFGNYNPNLPIVGADASCNNEIYTINNLPAGTIVTSWSSSNTNVATVTQLNATQVQVNVVGNGTITLTANVTNSCGQTAAIQKTGIQVGTPTIVNHTIYGGHNNVGVTTTSQLNVDYVSGATGYYWFITTLNSNCPNGGIAPRFQTGNGYSSTLTTTSKYAFVNWGNCPGNYIVNVRAINDCGASDISNKSVKVYGYYDNPCPQEPSKLKVYQKPVKGGSIIVNKPDPGIPCNDFQRTESKSIILNNVKIYDFYGNTVYTNRFNTNKFSINKLNLKTGSYILEVSSLDGEILRKLIIIE